MLSNIIIDTREKHPWFFEEPTLRKKLNTGDYSIEGFEENLAIERKTLKDLINSLTHQRKRFFKEIKRLSNLPSACIIVEGSLKKIILKEYEGNSNPNSIMGSITSINVDWNLPVHFCSNRACASLFASFWLSQNIKKLTNNISKSAGKLC